MPPVRIVTPVKPAQPTDTRQKMELTRSGLVVPVLAPSAAEVAARHKAETLPTLRPDVQALVVTGLDVDLAAVLSTFLDNWSRPDRAYFDYPQLPGGAAEKLVKLGLVVAEPGTMQGLIKGYSPAAKLKNPPKTATKAATTHSALKLDRRLR